MKDIFELYNINIKTAKLIKRVIFHLKEEGIHPDDFVEYIDNAIEVRRAEMRKREGAAIKPPSRVCPECGGVMVLRSVNDSPGTQTGDDSKYVWMCINCMEQIFVKEV